MAAEGLKAAGRPDGAAILKINNRKLLNGLLARAGVGRRGAQAHGAARRRQAGPAGRGGRHRPARRRPPRRIGRLHARRAGWRPRRWTRSWPSRGRRAHPAETLARLDAVVGGSEEGAAGLEELARIDAALKGMGVGEATARFDPAVVRGLEYYTGPVYEAEMFRPARAASAPAGLDRRRRPL